MTFNKIVALKPTQTFQPFHTLTRQFKQQQQQQPIMQQNTYGTALEQPIIAKQSTNIDTNQQYGQSSDQQTQTSFIPQQQRQAVFVPQQYGQSITQQSQPMRTFARVFQPESNKNWNTQSTVSAY